MLPSLALSNVALAFASGSSTTSAALGHNAHIVSVNDVYGGMFCYIARVAATLQNLQSTFLDLENASDWEILTPSALTQRSCRSRARRIPFFGWCISLGS